MDLAPLVKYAKPGKTLGVIGYGAFGRLVAERALSLGMTVILNDPPYENAQSEDIYEAVLTQWGNGMGGCESNGTQFETFMPLPILLKAADLISIQVPVISDGAYPTLGMIDPDFLSIIRPEVLILNFSDERIASVRDFRIIQCF